jgi:transposase
MELKKYGIGIDISKSKFTACVCGLYDDQEVSYTSSIDFENDKKGFNQFTRWVKKNTDVGVETLYLMEATGVYYENLAHHLFKIGKALHVALPTNTKHYQRSLNVKSKTDEIDSKVLSQFACERKHKLWQPPKPIYSKLRSLTRYQDQLKRERVAVSNRIHSKEHSFDIPKEILRQEKRLLKEIEKGIKVCLVEIEKLVATDKELALKVEKLSSIKGVGFLSVVTIIGETYGFAHFQSKKQLTSYAGFDVTSRESGSSIKGKTRISKKGNSNIRKALYFPAMVASRHNKELNTFYNRITQRRGVKKIGITAVSRKLLELLYILWKTDQYYIEDYHQQKTALEKTRAALDTESVIETVPL